MGRRRESRDHGPRRDDEGEGAEGATEWGESMAGSESRCGRRGDVGVPQRWGGGGWGSYITK
ncbi:hypothetical protein GCM10009814_38890 [Lapillicoccus jejuensis]